MANSTPHHTVYEQALAAHQQGHWSEAIALYQQAIALAPDQADRYYNLGVVLEQQERREQAIQVYHHAIALAPTYRQALENLSGLYLKQGHVDASIHHLATALVHHPQQASLWNNWGQALEAQQRTDDAIAAYGKAITLQPQLVRAHLNLGHLWEAQQQPHRAIAAYQAVLQQDAHHLDAHSRCGQLQFRAGNLAQAIHHWQAIAQAQPFLLQPYINRVESAAARRAQQHQPDDALHTVQKTSARFLQALLCSSSTADTAQALQHAYVALGQWLMQQQGYSLAERYFRRALRVAPRDPSLLCQLGDALSQQQRRDAATAVYQLAAQYAPPGHTQSKLTKATPPASPEDTPLSSNRPPLFCYAATAAWVKTTAIASVQYQPLAEPPAPSQPLSSPSVSDAPCDFPSPSAVPRSPALALPPVSRDMPPCGGVTCGVCMTALRQRFRPYQVRSQLYRCHPHDKCHPHAFADDPPLNRSALAAIAVEPYAPFVVTIPQGRVWVTPYTTRWDNGHSVAVFTPDRTLLSDLSRDYPWVLPNCQRPHRYRHRLLDAAAESLPPVRRVDGRVAVVAGLSSSVYYHWMVDILPRFGLLRQAGWQWHQFDAIIINGVRHPFQRETLALLGIPEDKLIESDRHPHLQATELVVPSFPGHFDWVPPSTITFLRNAFLPRALATLPPPPLKNFPPCLYISRTQADYRRVLNEEEVLTHLRPIGVVPVVLETLSVVQQAALFAQARLIIAPHGAGLTNLVFCKPGTIVIELTSPHYIRTDYWIVSHQVGLTHYVVQGEAVNDAMLRHLMYQSPLTEDIWLSSTALHSLMTLLHQWAAEPTMTSRSAVELDRGPQTGPREAPQEKTPAETRAKTTEEGYQP